MKNLKRLVLVGCLSLSFSSVASVKNSSELSILSSGGNTNVEVYNFKNSTSLVLGKHELTLSGHYTLGTSNDTVDARNWDIALNDRFSLSEFWGVYLGQKIEGDRFKGFEKRYYSDVGASYKLFDRDDIKSKVELGFRYVVEEKVRDGYAHDNQVRLFGDWDQVLNSTVSWKFFTEYLKNVKVGDAWELNFGPSLVASLSSIFSLKVGYEGNYRNLPAAVGNKKYDYKYTTGFIANF
jgi:putative salt-induced outer membrane protein